MKLFASLCLSLLFATSAFAAETKIELKSPDGKFVGTFYLNPDGRIHYEASRDGVPVVLRSKIGLHINGQEIGVNARKLGQKTYQIDEKYPFHGVHSPVTNKCNGIKIGLQTGDLKWILEGRCYNDGFAFRYLIPENGTQLVSKDTTTYVMPKGYKTKTLGVGRGEEARPCNGTTDKVKGGIAPPYIYYSEEKKRFNAILEGGGFAYHGLAFGKAKGGPNILKTRFFGNPKWETEGDIYTYWRIFCSTDDLNGLVNTDLPHNVCPAPDPTLFPEGANTEWIKPGIAGWNWWSKINIKKVSRAMGFVGTCRKLKTDYAVIDYGWEERWPRAFRYVCRKSKKKGVGIFLWKPSARNEGQMKSKHHTRYRRWVIPEDAEKRWKKLKNMADAGVKGIKLDYIDSENARWKRYMINVLKDCAKLKMMVIFHGCPIPAGESRTYPNEMSREAIYGLEKIRGGGAAHKIPSRFYINLAFTRFIAGHADFTPLVLNKWRGKGYTHAMQIASCIIFTSPICVLAEQPRIITNNPGVPIIRQMPTVWDETIVLPGSKFNDLAAYARRKGDEWYVAMINGFAKKPQEYSLPLNFLGEGEYDGLICKDAEAGPKPVMEQKVFKKSDTIQVKMKPTGGFVLRLRKKIAAE